MKLLKIGEIAKKTGISIRALHHYDEIGLLIPSQRSDSGYRLYTIDDLLQLQNIQSLQQLGFSLDTIKILMKQENPSLLSVINQHIKKLALELNKQQRLIEKLQKLATTLSSNTIPSVELLLNTLKETTMYEKYYTQEQLDKLAAQREALGEEAMKKTQQEWETIFEQFRQLLEAGKPASCDQAQQLAKRSYELIEEFTGGDSAMKQSMQNMYDSEGGDKVLSEHGMDVDKELFAYITKAMELVKKD